jgi:hypothetical protein
MERDPKTGRFLKGNKAAVGNRGNTNPKWGNKNAMIHGFYASYVICKVRDDGNLLVSARGKPSFIIKSSGFTEDDEGTFWFRDDVAEKLKEYGYRFDIVLEE